MPAWPRDPEKTRNAILNAAEHLFAQRGYNGVAMSEIAKAAGVTQSLIHHHFESKANLWSLVLDRFEKVLPPVTMGSLEHKAGRKDLEALIAGYFHGVHRNPNLARLDAWGKLENPGAMTELDKQALAQVRDRIAYLQRAGDLRKEPPPEHIIIIIQALVKNWWLGRAQYLDWIGGDGEDADARYLETLLGLVFDGLSPR